MNTHQPRLVTSSHSPRTQGIMEECWARDLGYNEMIEFLGRSVHFWPSRNEYENLCQSMNSAMDESFKSHQPPEAPETLTTLQVAFMSRLNALEYAAEQLIGSTLAKPPQEIEASEAIVAFEILKEINRHRPYLGDLHPCVLPEADFVDVPELDPELCYFDRTGQEPEQ